MDGELFLSHLVSDPAEAHVNGFGTLLFDGVVDDSFSARVVGLDWSWRLWMAEEF